MTHPVYLSIQYMGKMLNTRACQFCFKIYNFVLGVIVFKGNLVFSPKEKKEIDVLICTLILSQNVKSCI